VSGLLWAQASCVYIRQYQAWPAQTSVGHGPTQAAGGAVDPKLTRMGLPLGRQFEALACTD